MWVGDRTNTYGYGIVFYLMTASTFIAILIWIARIVMNALFQKGMTYG